MEIKLYCLVMNPNILLEDSSDDIYCDNTFLFFFFFSFPRKYGPTVNVLSPKVSVYKKCQTFFFVRRKYGNFYKISSGDFFYPAWKELMAAYIK